MSAAFRSTAVVGAGAVGSYFGALLARSGHAVTLIGRPVHVEAMQRDGLRLRRDGGEESIAVAASVDLSAVGGADLVLVCVKSTDTAAVARDLRPHLAPGAVVLSLQNGVENAATLAAELGTTVLPAVVYVATEMAGPGCVAHHGRGDLVIGTLRGAERAPRTAQGAPLLDAVVEFFASAGVPVRVADDVSAELWSKLMINCAYNAVSALAQAPYAALAALPAVRDLQATVVREVVAVAAADGVALPLDAALQSVARIATAMPAQLSSTAQDMARGKPSEIDHLNGFIVRRGAALGIATPANQALHALVKLVEAQRGA